MVMRPPGQGHPQQKLSQAATPTKVRPSRTHEQSSRLASGEAVASEQIRRSWSMMEIVNTLYQIGLPTSAGIFIFLAYLRPTIRLLNRTIHRRFKITRIVRATWMVLTFLSYGQSRKELYRAAC